MEEELRIMLDNVQREMARIDKHAKLEGAQVVLLHLLGVTSNPYRELLKGDVKAAKRQNKQRY